MGSWLVKLLSLLPYVVSGIEQIHGDAKSGVEKKQLAMEALGLASGVATAADPSQKAAIAAATDLVSNAIDGVKNVYNAAVVKKAPSVPAVSQAVTSAPKPDPLSSSSF